MSAAQVLEQARAMGIMLSSGGGKLRYEAPAGCLTPELRAALSAHKPEILAALASQEEAEALDLREAFEERAGILEFDAGLSRSAAELEASRITATLARNRGFAWASLRAALAEYPVLLSQLPDKPGPVDALPLGVATLAPVLKGRRVVRQGAFTGTHEVKA